MGEPVALRTADFRRKAESIESVFTEFGLVIEPGSDLANLLMELRWAGQFNDVFVDAAEADRKRAINAVLFYDVAVQIEHAVRRSSISVGVESKLRHLCRNKLNALTTSTGPGLEALFELDVAARLVNSEWRVFFEEPDIILESPVFGPCAVACKRPQRESSVRKNVFKAARQVADSGMPGFVFISVDGFAPRFLGRLQSKEHLCDAGSKYLEGVLNNCTTVIAKIFDYEVGGVIICGRFNAMVTNPSSYCWALRTMKIANPGMHYAQQATEAIDAIFRETALPRFSATTV